MDPQKECLRLLREHGRRERHNKHETWRVNGHLIAITNTRTDERGWRNKFAEVRRALKTPYSSPFVMNSPMVNPHIIARG